MTQDCVVQGEMTGPIRKDNIDLPAGPTNQLDDMTLRYVFEAIGYVMDSDCEPN